MTVKSLKILLAATALGVGALAYSGPADARVRGGWRTHYGWHYGWYKGWHRGPVVASDDDVAPPRRRARHRDCVLASDYDLGPRRVRHDDCVLASDCDLGPRRACRDDCVVASDYVAPPACDYGCDEPVYYEAPVVYSPPVVYAPPVVYSAPVVYTSGWYSPWGYGWPF